MRRFRMQGANNLLDEVMSTRPTEVVVHRVVVPLFHLLADDDPGVLGFAGSVIEHRLLAVAKGWERMRGPTVVLACAPRERHTLGLIAFGIALAERGLRITYLGAATPVESLLTVASGQRPALMVVSTAGPAMRQDECGALRALAHEVPVAIGGSGAATLSAMIGARALRGDAFTMAADVARRTMTHPRSPRRDDAGSPRVRASSRH